MLTQKSDLDGCFLTDKHRMVQSNDGSFTAYSAEFDEHYHSTKDGALLESLQKHVIPALLHVKDKEEISILDICFGLGFNTLATLYYMKKEGIQKRLTIYSPEFDKELIASLKYFVYPEIFLEFKKIIDAVSETGMYRDESLHISLYLGDAREFLRDCNHQFDIVYQDAFSPASNPILWTKEYFADIARVMKEDGILTTYSISLATRLALHVSGFYIYLCKPEGCRSSTLASFKELNGYERVNMEHKIFCNQKAKPLSDSEI
ncbi:MAG: MnmC family methyltransferase [Thiovulaceae bacterium]|nr:MnmC family methyltransferase [Sulfurimonadaceae bacterium]